ncbi:MAG: cupredoxin domain-containing protein [bacterium]|nr:cupredoxin domain-containing protein [bacterium]
MSTLLNKRNILIGAAVVVVLVVIVLLAGRGSGPGSSGPGGQEPPAGPPAPPAGSVTREAAPENVVVPEEDSKNVPENVAVPTDVTTAGAQKGADHRTYEIKADNNTFTPDTIIVNAGDLTDIYITAVDRNYDFTQPDYGFRTQIPKGSRTRIAFTAGSAGKFTFYCDVCGGFGKGATGYIIAATK